MKPNRPNRCGRYTDSFVKQADGGFSTRIPLESTAFCWAMLLSEDGSLLWQEKLPDNLNHNYTAPEIASFTRWYLDDYPVMVYRNDFGLVVADLPRGSMTRFDFYMDSNLLNALLKGVGPLLLLDVGIVLLLCLWLGWKAAGPLRGIAQGIDELAEGRPICLQAVGSAAELAEQLEHNGPDTITRQKASSIRVQSMKIKKLVEDLNLTSKLQYNAHPLRLEAAAVGPWLRESLADFCDGLDKEYSVEISMSEFADRQVLMMDKGLMTRALDNLLVNSVRHNPDGCLITVFAGIEGDCFRLLVKDNGTGYPREILEVLRGSAEKENAPHILGLYLVCRIVEAHHGSVRFFNDTGAVCEMIVRLVYPDSAQPPLPFSMTDRDLSAG